MDVMHSLKADEALEDRLIKRRRMPNYCVPIGIGVLQKFTMGDIVKRDPGRSPSVSLVPLAKSIKTGKGTMAREAVGDVPVW